MKVDQIDESFSLTVLGRGLSCPAQSQSNQMYLGFGQRKMSGQLRSTLDSTIPFPPLAARNCTCMASNHRHSKESPNTNVYIISRGSVLVYRHMGWKNGREAGSLVKRKVRVKLRKRDSKKVEKMEK